MKTIAENRRARFDLEITETFEAGMVLSGDEIKSIRADRVQLTGAYVKLLRGNRHLPRVVLLGVHMALAVDPERTRTLMLTKREVEQLAELISVKGMTAVPLNLHFKRGWAKVTIGVGKGRKTYDKRSLLRERDVERAQKRENTPR